MDFERIQQALRDERLDGWLFYDFRKSNPIAYRVLALSPDDLYTRRWFYFVPAHGVPMALVSAVEEHVLRSLPGKRLVFRTWREMQLHLQTMLPPGTRIAMEYSSMNAIPYMSRVDAGMMELVRSLGVEVVSSADIAQRFIAQLSIEQLESHREAGRRLIAVKDILFTQLGEDVYNNVPLDEYQVQQRFRDLVHRVGLVMEEQPLVAVNANSGNPHYEPTNQSYSPIQRGDLVLFDFWAHLPQQGAIFADYTWMAFVGTCDEIPARQREIFEIVRRARDTGITYIRERLAEGERVEGRQVDDVVRTVIENAGYGDYFIHRTGHSITEVEHGNGANLDNFETQDARVLLPNTCYSVEPGIYLPEFGIRSEINILVLERDVEVTGAPAQEEIIALLR